MITYSSGDILADDAHALVNPVNCVGVMGKGLANQFKQRFPTNYAAYRQHCDARRLLPGRIFIHRLPTSHPPFSIINFPTKDHWRDPSTINYLNLGLTTLVKALASHSIASVAIPALGAGLGGLSWDQVHQLLLEHLRHLDSIDVRIYTPHTPPHHTAKGDPK